jgi:hypothetical protein
VQRAKQAAGLGIGVFCFGWVLIVLLSLVFGNWGLPKAADCSEAYAPAEVHVNVTHKKDKKQKHNQVGQVQLQQQHPGRAEAGRMHGFKLL